MSAQKSGTQDFSGASDAQKTRTYNTRSNPKGVDNKIDSFDGYISASSRKDKRKANQSLRLFLTTVVTLQQDKNSQLNLNHRLLSLQTLWTLT